MSRCFPFPPPGYELKAKPDDVDTLIKDKQKHKKHKDKKERDKKEGSERENERSENKHKEDKKRKRKEDKDREDKNKKDKRGFLGVFLENQNGQKLVPDDVELGKVQENGNDLLATKDRRDHNRMVVNGQSLSFSELDRVRKMKEGNESNGYRSTVQENGDAMLASKDKRDHNTMMVNGQSHSFSELDKVRKTKEGKESNGYRNIMQENGNDMLATKDKRDHNRMVVNGQSLSFSELGKVGKTKEGKQSNGYRNTAHDNGNGMLATKDKRDHNRVVVDGQSLSFSELDKVGKMKERKENNGYRNTVQENGNAMLETNDNRDHNRIVNGQSFSFSELYKVEETEEGKESNGYRHTVQENGMLATKDKRDCDRMVNDRSPIFMESDKVEKTKKQKQSNGYINTVLENGNDMLATKDKRDCNRMLNGQSLSFSELDKVEKTKEGKESNGHRNTVDDKDDSKNEDQIKITRVEDKKTKEEKDHIKNTKEEKKKMKEEKKKRKEEKKIRKEEKRKRKEQKKKENIECQGKLPKLKELSDFLDAKENGVRPYDMSQPSIVSHQAGHSGGGVRPSQNTITLGVGERAVITDQKVNPKLSSPQSVIDGVKNNGPCQTANNRKTENGRVSVNNHVVSSGVISPHIVRIERKVEPYQTCNGVAMTKQIVNRNADGKIPFAHPFAESEGKTAVQAPDAFHKMHKKESMMNGPLEGIKSSSSMPSSASLKGKEKVATATTKPPHPDLKYLSQILAVPEVEWPQCDEQEWLFNHKDSQSKRPKLDSSETQWTKQVWSEAVVLESADVTALPYVIPY